MVFFNCTTIFTACQPTILNKLLLPLGICNILGNFLPAFDIIKKAVLIVRNNAPVFAVRVKRRRGRAYNILGHLEMLAVHLAAYFAALRRKRQVNLIHFAVQIRESLPLALRSEIRRFRLDNASRTVFGVFDVLFNELFQSRRHFLARTPVNAISYHFLVKRGHHFILSLPNAVGKRSAVDRPRLFYERVQLPLVNSRNIKARAKAFLKLKASAIIIGFVDIFNEIFNSFVLRRKRGFKMILRAYLQSLQPRDMQPSRSVFKLLRPFSANRVFPTTLDVFRNVPF